MPTITVKRMEKRIRGADGKIRKLVSYDGSTWLLDPLKARRRVTAATNLHGKKQEKKIAKAFDAYMGTHASDHSHTSGPVILPVTHIGSPVIGKEKGKNQKYRRNLKRKKDLNVVQREIVPGFGGIGMIPKPVHKHRCKNCNYRFMCSCDEPYFRTLCGGGKLCLRQRKEA